MAIPEEIASFSYLNHASNASDEEKRQTFQQRPRPRECDLQTDFKKAKNRNEFSKRFKRDSLDKVICFDSEQIKYGGLTHSDDKTVTDIILLECN